MCLLACLQKSEPVPDLPYPMYTASMTKLIVTSTGFSKDKKEEIQMKVERMGGIYSNAFHDGVTHLVCNEVRSKKYDVAVLKEIPIMTSDWVHQVRQVASTRCPNKTVIQQKSAKKTRQSLFTF